ncbi:uncharacterized protein LOC131681120 [Topomyia yanbarensis]|uniref:uncharacterized protein LOC131681120 n=1 Tax=Topomyia yanbarensis TaxID=2498891 RepID=UPI00273BE8F8|nr:uncharacterized protein LOC131681120 [Topomyia yanbarensis]
MSSTMMRPTKTATGIVQQTENTTTSGTGARQECRKLPISDKQTVLDRALEGISLNDTAVQSSLGGLIGRTSESVVHKYVTSELDPPQPVLEPVLPSIRGMQLATQVYRTFPPTQTGNEPKPFNHAPTNIQVGLFRSLLSNSPVVVGTGESANSATVLRLIPENVSQPRPIADESEPIPASTGGYPMQRSGFEPQPFLRQPSGHLPQRSGGQSMPAPTARFLSGFGATPMPRVPTWNQGGQQGQSANQLDEPTRLPYHGGPNPQQLAARQVISKELPFFSGNPEDWPLFISSYVNTTEACGYSDAENLARLQRCLKGNAFEAVRSRLLLPAPVSHVIATLETLYGRPELLIHTLLQKVRNVPGPKQDRLDTFIGYGLAVQNLCDHLEAGGHEAHLNNPMLLFELVDKLPVNTKLDWSLYKERCREVNIRSFSQYMSTLVRAANDVTLHYEPRQPQQQFRPKDKHFCGAHVAEEPAKTPGKACLVCKDPKHRVKNCGVFAKKTLDERWKTIQELRLCRICLGAHGKRPCRIRTKCEIDGCQLRHHSLIHSKQTPSALVPRQEKLEPKPSGSDAVTNHHYAGKAALFRIIPVELHGTNRSVSTYAFLDDGSSRTLVDEDIAIQLGVTGDSLPLCLQWTANMKRIETDSQRIALKIRGEAEVTKFTLNDVRTVSKLDLPRQSLRYAELAESFPYLKGLPIKDYENALPRILIGNDNAHVTAMHKIRVGQPGEPIAAKSRLGWTVYGKQEKSVDRAHSFHICECQDDRSLHDLVKQFFSVESMGIEAVGCPESPEVQRANNILQKTTKRVGQRFETGLLWRYDCFEFPDSYPMAVRRLQCLERRILKDPVIGESVVRQLSEYQAKGYIHKATPEELEEADPRRTWYLPLGVVLNPKKPSKIRIFCDAAAKVDGISLNTMLLKGPDLLNSLLTVLFGFRERRVALCADLKEMFHQVKIRREDRHAQRMLWRDDPSMEPTVYLIDVATFGAACSPCSSQHVKNRNAEEHAQEFPAAADAIIRKHYVDDYLDSADSEVLARVGEDDPASEKCIQMDKNCSMERVLGMYWKPEEDVFTFSTTLAIETNRPTKRQALQVVMSPFDPAGLLCFFLVHGKILIQEVWRAKTEWDQPIPLELNEKWTRWTALFQYLNQIRVPRCYFPEHSIKEVVSLQLHIFVDASEEAYACVAYLRAEFPGSVIRVALVGGKAKVAPLKTLSIPRLKLNGAVIGVRLRKAIINGHTLKIDKTVMWTDSKTVLAWINADHRRYRQFVSCRVGETLSKSDAAKWRYVPSKMNPADLATKWGVRGPCFSANSPWFGEFFLGVPETQWPSEINAAEETTDEELRPCLVHSEVILKSVINWDRFSNWTRLQRAVAYVLRYRKILQQRSRNEAPPAGPITQQELALAESTIYRLIQSEMYPDEIAILTTKEDHKKMRRQKLERTSKIRKLSPYMDDTGIIRSDSRIPEASFAAYDTRFPIILPKEHVVTRMLLEWYHRTFLHANGETVVNEVRQRFYVSTLRTIVRQIARECVMCKANKAVPVIPRMAPLPVARVKAFERPFSYVGIDYFGPIAVRVNRSTAKRWIALFTCLTTRAIHLEVVHTLTTESCKQAIRRFVGRRGSPAEIRSDQGTNFVGANNELRKEMIAIDGQLAESFTNTNTRWIFNPPAAPHMGGAWERLVRSVKVSLAAMYTSRIPNEETLATLVIEAESVVNSRPLTFIPLEAEQQEALTPNHFLLSSSRGVVQPPKEQAEPKMVCRGDWKLCQAMLNQFWRRWVREYLPTIARRTKWFEETKPIEVGDLVVIVEEKIRNGWVLGRVVQVMKGSDGRIRDAVIQTADGIKRRPVAKLARLDVDRGKTGADSPDQPYGSGNVTEDRTRPSSTPRLQESAARRVQD